MGRPFDPARETRTRLQVLEQRAKARRATREVADGVSESVALARARGASFVRDEPAAGARETPYRRQTGLAWLLRKGRISARQAAAGEAYGAAYRRARAAPSIGSTLEVQPGGNLQGGPSVAQIVRMARGREEAEVTLARCRARLLNQADLITACDLCCGDEMTPREAAGTDRDAARLEAVLSVALDILAT